MTAVKRRDKVTDMTEGSIFGHLITFALPLLLGNLFQQLYNTVDTWVVGNYVSNEAFSAVGSVAPIINMLIGFFSGLASGAGVVISQFYGAKQFDRVEKAVHTAAALTAVMCVLLTAVGLFFIPFALDLMNTPPEVVPESTDYLIIYFAGISGLLIYNMGSGILRAVGDSRRPFYYLVTSALINIVLDLVFVLVPFFDMGVRGVALATVIAQGVSAVLVIRALLKTKTCVRFYPRKTAFDRAILFKTIAIGIPAALQLAITAFSNIFVMSYINYFGADCMSGWTAYTKIDQFMFLPMQSVALAATTFVGQNLGANKEERARRGVTVSLLTSLGITAVIMAPVLIFAPHLTAFFNSKPEVVEYGTLLLQWNTPFYLLCCFNQVYAAALRGAGNSRIPMITMLLSFVLFRQGYLFIMSNYICNEVVPIALAYPAGWFVCSLLIFLYYLFVGFGKQKVVD